MNTPEGSSNSHILIGVGDNKKDSAWVSCIVSSSFLSRTDTAELTLISFKLICMAEGRTEETWRKTYRRSYTVRALGGGFSTSIPKLIIDRKAREVGMEPEEFVEKYEVEILFNEFSGIDGAFRFVRKHKKMSDEMENEVNENYKITKTDTKSKFKEMAHNCEHKFFDNNGFANCAYHPSAIGYCQPNLCPRLRSKQS